MNLVFPEYLNINSMETIISNLNKTNGHYDLIDLSNIKFIFPYGLNLLLHAFEEINSFNNLELPNPKIMSYLIRMDFFKQIEKFSDLPEEILYDISLYDNGVDGDNKTLLEITKIEHFTDVFPVIKKIDEKIKTILETHLGYTNEEINKFRGILDELCQNISRHSKSHGYVSVQYVPYYYSEGTKYTWPVKIGITDLGIGFAKTYGENISDKQALVKAVIENETSKKKGGLGLKYIKSYVREFGGELFIRSGTASYFQKGINGNYEINSNLNYFKGSQISVALPKRNLK